MSTYLLDYGRHLARLRRRRRRRRAYAPTSNTASHDNHKKILMGFLFFPVVTLGLRLAALRAAGAPLLTRSLVARDFIYGIYALCKDIFYNGHCVIVVALSA